MLQRFKMRKFNIISYILRLKSLQIKEILQIKTIALYLFNYKNILSNFYLKNYNCYLKMLNLIYWLKINLKTNFKKDLIRF